MLKIEVIKFEAQDVITASTAAPEEKPAECICTDGHDVENCMYRGIHDKCIAGGYEGHHNCEDYVQVN